MVTKSNPFSYYKHLVPAQLMAIASVSPAIGPSVGHQVIDRAAALFPPQASSAATIPVTLKSAIASGQVAPFIGGFVIPLGATLNMDGGGIYFPLATIFLAVTSGLEDQITPAAMLKGVRSTRNYVLRQSKGGLQRLIVVYELAEATMEERPRNAGEGQ